MQQVTLIGGSPALASRSSAVLDEVAIRIRNAGIHIERVEVRELDPVALVRADFSHPSILAAAGKLATADAVVIATPVYKASFSGVLKAFFDLLDRDALQGKPILPIATGGTIAHLLSIDYSLRPVLCALQASHILTGCFVQDRDVLASGPQRGITDALTRERIQNQVDTLLASLGVSPVSELAEAC